MSGRMFSAVNGLFGGQAELLHQQYPFRFVNGQHDSRAGMPHNGAMNLKAAVVLRHFFNHSEYFALQNFFGRDDLHAFD